MQRWVAFLAAAMLCAAGSFAPATAQDKLKVAAAHRGNWDTAVPEMMQRFGLAKKHGLDLEIVWLPSGSETQNAVTGGNSEVGVGVRLTDVLRGFAQGASPLRILASQSVGAQDYYWYVPAASPIKSWTEGNIRTIGYSTVTPPTFEIATAFIAQHALKAQAVATGGPAATLTLVLSGQVDVGWAPMPFGLDELEKNEIRVIGRGSDTIFAGRTQRVSVATSQTVNARKDVLTRFFRAYRETLASMYTDEGVRAYADWLAVDAERARRMRDAFYPRAALEPDGIAGFEATLADAVAQRILPAPLTKAQIDDLVRPPAP